VPPSQPVRPGAAGDQSTAGGRHARPEGQETSRRASDPRPEQGTTTAHADGDSSTARNHSPGQHADAASAGHQPNRHGQQDGHRKAPARHDRTEPPSGQDPGDTWPPPDPYRDSARDLYQHDFGANAAPRTPAGGWELGSSILGITPEGSPDEDLAETDGDKLSRLGKFGKVACEEIEDIRDVSEEDGGTIKELFDRPPTESLSAIPAGHPAIEQPSAPGVDGGHLVVAALALGIVGIEAGRAAKKAVHKWKER
jgi:hypothetical protein